MKKSSTLILKSVLWFIAFLVGAGLLMFPQLEGRAVGLDLVSIYSDPFIIYIYVASIPFFASLYHAYKLLVLIDKNKIFSRASIESIQKIKYYALLIIVFQILAILYIRLFVKGDDPAGPTMMGIIVLFTSTIIVTIASVIQKLLQNAIDIKSENDLTV